MISNIAEGFRQADLVEIIYYTDPLCCWSWAMEPQWRKLLYNGLGKIKVRYCMGGLLPGWQRYHDSVNAVQKPVQMGPVWMHAMQLSGMPIKHNIWITDPPASSYLACIAVKCAMLQSTKAGERYLRLLREAIMINGINATNEDGVTTIAVELATEIPFDVDQFKTDLTKGNGLEAFRKDLQEVQYLSISRFPSFVIKQPSTGKALVLSGYQSYGSLVNAVQKLGVIIADQQINSLTYTNYWQSLTEKELAEIQ